MKICTLCREEKPLSVYYTLSIDKSKYYSRCKECHAKNNKRNWELKRDQYYISVKKWVSKNREKCLEHTREWRKKNLKYDAFRAKLYRTRKTKQLPIWANQEKIKEIYLNCPKGYHVDHIIPLKGKLVSGLHVETNLQYLPAKENLAKRNLYEIK